MTSSRTPPSCGRAIDLVTRVSASARDEPPQARREDEVLVHRHLVVERRVIGQVPDARAHLVGVVDDVEPVDAHASGRRQADRRRGCAGSSSFRRRSGREARRSRPWRWRRTGARPRCGPRKTWLELGSRSRSWPYLDWVRFSLPGGKPQQALPLLAGVRTTAGPLYSSRCPGIATRNLPDVGAKYVIKSHACGSIHARL